MASLSAKERAEQLAVQFGFWKHGSYCDAIKQAILAAEEQARVKEREACAQEADDAGDEADGRCRGGYLCSGCCSSAQSITTRTIVSAIRSRGTKGDKE